MPKDHRSIWLFAPFVASSVGCGKSAMGGALTVVVRPLAPSHIGTVANESNTTQLNASGCINKTEIKNATFVLVGEGTCANAPKSYSTSDPAATDGAWCEAACLSRPGCVAYQHTKQATTNGVGWCHVFGSCLQAMTGWAFKDPEEGASDVISAIGAYQNTQCYRKQSREST